MYPAGAAGIAVRFVDVHGIRTRVLEAGPANGRPIVLLHGWCESVYTFDATIPALAAGGCRVLAFDLPGHGLSDKPNGEEPYTTDALARFVRNAMHATAIDRATIVGHSMGAGVALRLVRTHPSSVERLVLLSPVGLGSSLFIHPVRWLTPRIVDRITPAIMTRTLFHLVLRIAFGTRDRPTRRDVDQYWAPTQFDEYARACRACAHAFTWNRLTTDELASLALPVLVVAGGRDRIVYGIEKRARRIPNAQVVVVPDGGHLVVQDCSSRVNQEILRFLAGS
jgi:pimeloyl-ACP methyl ester carboxylesterase